MRAYYLGAASEVWSACTDIYYIIRRERDRETAVAFLADLFDACELCGLDKAIILQALQSSFKDFEDAVQNFAAVAAGLDIIVTRNARDFKDSSLPVMSPSELIETIENT
jgi:hypothetical protein